MKIKFIVAILFFFLLCPFGGENGAKDYQQYIEEGNALYAEKKYSEAIKKYDKAAKKNPSEATPHHYKAILFSKLGKKKKALKEYSKAIETDPDYADAYRTKGIILYNFGQYEESLEQYDIAIKNNPDNAKAYSYKAGSLLEIKKNVFYKVLSDAADGKISEIPDTVKIGLNEIMELCDKAAELDPELAEAYYYKGIVFYYLGEKEKALEEYNKATNLYPAHSGANAAKGVYLYNAGKYEQALHEFNKALSSNPANQTAHLYRGMLLVISGDGEEALKEFDKAGDDLYAYKASALSALLKKEEAAAEYEKALGKLNEKLLQDPASAVTYHNKAVVLAALERYEESLPAYDEAIRLNPKDPQIYYSKGQSLFEMKKYEEAASAFDKVLGLSPGMLNAYLSKGGSLLAAQKCEEALKAYEEAERLAPYLADIHIYRSYVFLAMGEKEEALKEVEKARGFTNYTAAVYHIAKGWVLFKFKEYDKALEEFNKADENKNSYMVYNRQEIVSGIYIGQGAALMRMGQTYEGYELLQKAVSIRPSSSGGHYYLTEIYLDFNSVKEALASFEKYLSLTPKPYILKDDYKIWKEKLDSLSGTQEKGVLELRKLLEKVEIKDI